MSEPANHPDLPLERKIELSLDFGAWMMASALALIGESALMTEVIYEGEEYVVMIMTKEKREQIRQDADDPADWWKKGGA